MHNRNYSNYKNSRKVQAEDSNSLACINGKTDASNSRNLFARISDRYKLNKLDWTLIVALLVGLIYFLVREPLVAAILLTSGLFFFCTSQILSYIPAFNKLVGTRIRFWHVATIILALTMLFSTFDLPAHALFLSTLEQSITTLVTASGLGTTVASVFTAIRVVFVLLIVAAALFAYNQAQQGNDWRPIVTQAAMAIGIVMIVDVLSALFLGTGGGTGGGGGGAAGG